MGISRDRRHKRRATGGRMPVHQKKRQYELGRPAAMTKLGVKRVRPVRCRGGNQKWRALRLDSGNFSLVSEGCTRKARIVSVVYNASNNELVRTNTLVKNTIVQIDAAPFRAWFMTRYGKEFKKKTAGEEETVTETAVTKEHAPGTPGYKKQKAKARRAKTLKLSPLLEEQLISGRLYACISSRPGQVGNADGYLIEGEELEFYKKKLDKKRK